MAFGDFTVDRNSAKYVLGSGGDIISYATDEPAFEFNADGSYKGLLVEPAATNICLHSEDFNSWGFISQITVTTDATTAPDGNTTADNLANNDAGGTNFHYRSNSVSLTTSTQYTFSVFAKYNTGSGIIWLLGEGSNDIFCFFDIQNGLVTQSTNFDNATITDYGNGWYRCAATFTKTSATASEAFGVGVCLTSGTPDFDSTGIANQEQVYLWGAQLETGPIATSYIPTTTASVTRNADDITQTSASSLIGQTEGTIYVEAYIPKLSYEPFVVGISDGFSLGEAIYLQSDASGNLVVLLRTGGSTTTISIANANWTAGLNKVAIKYKVGTNNSALVLNGGSPVTGSPANLPAFNKITLGARPDIAGGLALNGHIRAVALFTRALSDAECQALTTL